MVLFGGYFMSKICTFFGHRDTPDTIRPVLHETVVKLIEEGKADTFYVGNQGNFDSMVYEELKILKEQYPHIRYAVILAYKPTEENYKLKKEYADKFYPASLDYIHPKYAILKRNYILVNAADIVITYVTRPTGGAAKFKNIAEIKGRKVINIS